MNGGYIIIKDDISSKINVDVGGRVNYKGAYDYASEVFRSGKVALISIKADEFVSLLDITQVGSETMIAWFFAGSTYKATISFDKENPDVFDVSVVKGA